MSIVPKKNPLDLNEAEIAFLRGSGVSPDVRAYLSRQHENIGTKITAFRKVAAAARAEADALLAVRELSQVQGEETDLSAARRRIAELEQRAQILEVSGRDKDRRIAQLTAGPMMAVSGD